LARPWKSISRARTCAQLLAPSCACPCSAVCGVAVLLGGGLRCVLCALWGGPRMDHSAVCPVCARAKDTLRSLTNSADDADILKSLGLVASTLGLLVGTMLGCGLVNWAAFRGYLAAPSAVTPEAAPSPAASAAAAGSVMGRAAAGKERSDGLERESGRRTTSASSVSGPEL
jgi:hypothetical protein